MATTKRAAKWISCDLVLFSLPYNGTHSVLFNILGSIQYYLLLWEGSKSLRSILFSCCYAQACYNPLDLINAPTLYSRFFAAPHHKLATRLSLHHILKLSNTTSAYEGCEPINSHNTHNQPCPSPQYVHGIQCTQHHIFLLWASSYREFPYPSSSLFPHSPNKHTQDSESDDSNIPAASIRKIVDQTLVCASVW